MHCAVVPPVAVLSVQFSCGSLASPSRPAGPARQPGHARAAAAKASANTCPHGRNRADVAISYALRLARCVESPRQGRRAMLATLSSVRRSERRVAGRRDSEAHRSRATA
ncbi:hypothetical protein ERJ75_000347200 [Trypanosoma vivax]|nr:hypothetical protein ERJ75_000347200 [Trypanosoma vivax]